MLNPESFIGNRSSWLFLWKHAHIAFKKRCGCYSIKETNMDTYDRISRRELHLFEILRYMVCFHARVYIYSSYEIKDAFV